MQFLCPWMCACGGEGGGSENSHFLGKNFNHILLPQFKACYTEFSSLTQKKKANIINSINLTSPSLKMSGNLHTKYLRMCAKRGIFMAVHVRNMLPMSPLDTGALSETKQFITAPRNCHLFMHLSLAYLPKKFNCTHTFNFNFCFRLLSLKLW